MGVSIEYLDATGEDSAGVAKDWGTDAAGDSASEKRWIRNNGTLDLSGLVLSLSDVLLNGGVGVFLHALDTVAVRPPYGGAAVEGNGSPATSHVLNVGETWYFRVTRVNATGETQGSVEFSYTVADDTKDVDLTWSLPGGPASTSIRIYATQTSGDYSDTDVRIATGLGGAATSHTWDGSAPSGGTFPSANTTASASGPNYGTAPSLATSDLSIGTLAVGEARAFWKGYEAPAGSGDQTYAVDTVPEET